MEASIELSGVQASPSSCAQKRSVTVNRRIIYQLP
jgi:hypothetical protein